jgi:hypothetical protein
MNKANFLKTVLLLWGLIVGIGNVSAAEDYDYEWVKVTDLSQVESGEIVLLVDVDKSIALPYNSNNVGASVTISEDGTIADNVSDKLKWKMTKGESDQFTFTSTGDEYQVPLYGYSNGELSVGKNSNYSGDYTTNFIFEEYGENGGLLGCFFNSYITLKENAGAYRAVLNDTGSKITLYKRAIKNYVKWKRIDSDKVNLEEDAVIVVVDLESGRALSNDKADKDPDAVAVTLNDDNDRILGEVPEKVQWISNITKGKGITLKTKDEEGDKYLYADTENKGLKVGEPTGDNQYFSCGCTNNIYFSLWTSIESATYLLGVEESMFSNTWKLIKQAEGEDDIDLAFFKKVVDPQKVVTIELAENYFGYYGEDNNMLNLNATCIGAELSEIQWGTSDKNVATVANGIVTYKGEGTVVITASVTDNDYHDKASAQCTVRIENVNSDAPGSVNNPLTVAQAKVLAEKGKVTVNGAEVKWKAGFNYHIKGKVSKVNSGMLAMFGDMDFGSMGGDDSGMNFDDMMDDMDFDMDSMDDMGFDMSSLGFDMSALFGNSDGLTYYISDDGTKDNQLKVLNGYDSMRYLNGEAVFEKDLDLSPGDDVVVCGPLVKSKDENMLSSLMGGGDEEETWKVGEINYQTYQKKYLEVEDKEVYVNNSLPLSDLYKINEGITCVRMEDPTIKSSDEEIAKWDEENKVLTGVQVGTAKITVKIKVILQEKVEGTEGSEGTKEKSYTMKRKFKLNVLTRDVEPAGKYAGDYVLTTKTSDLDDGTRLVLVGTRVKDDKETDYIMGENNSMMGGGKSGSKIEIKGDKTAIPCEDVPDGTLEVVLEKAGDFWYLNVGKDENGDNLYLYASEKIKEESSSNENENTSGFNFDEMMEMFNPSSGLKVGTKAGTVNPENASVDSLKATITISGDIATIKFPTAQNNNMIMLSSAFDMESMMTMFGGEGEGGGEQGGTSTGTGSFDMGSFDMFMASFNTKKEGDEKSFMPRIYRYVPDKEFDISIGGSYWSTIVTYNDVTVPSDLEAYVVTKVKDVNDEKTAILQYVTDLKGGHPYLLHSERSGDFTLTLAESAVDAPEKNLLEVSDAETGDGVFVLAKKNGVVAFYEWTGGLLGSGRVYLPAESGASLARILIDFYVEPAGIATGITDVKQSSDMKAYDLQGRRVSVTKGQVTKGLYIVNGKKVVVK